MRELALRLMSEWEAEGKYINLALNSHSLDGISKEERAILTSLLYTTVEKKLSYDYYIASLSKRSLDKIDSRVLNILRLGACQIIDMKSIPDFAAVNESVKLAKNPGEKAFINAVLREISRKAEKCELPLPPYEKNVARHFSVKFSLPLWIVKKFITELGEEDAVKLFELFNSEPPLTVTVNSLKISRENFLKELYRSGISAEKSSISPLSVRIFDKVNPKNIYGYEEGYFFVQDEASALAVLALSPKKNEKLFDVCSAPGGKSFSSAILMEGCGKILSADLRRSKLSLIENGASRLGFSSLIEVIENDASETRPEYTGAFDKLICDVPCSGLGVISKKPDLRYRSEEGASELPGLQYKILSASSKYLRAGGEMIYSTCTLLKEENEEVVKRFLFENPDFSAVDFEIGSLRSTAGALTLYPHINGTDGFFISKLRKIK